MPNSLAPVPLMANAPRMSPSGASRTTRGTGPYVPAEDVAVAREREDPAHVAADGRAPDDLPVGVETDDLALVRADVDRSVVPDDGRAVDVRAEVRRPGRGARRVDRIDVVVLRADDHEAVVGHGGRREDLALRREAPRDVTAAAHGQDRCARREDDRAVLREDRAVSASPSTSSRQSTAPSGESATSFFASLPT